MSALRNRIADVARKVVNLAPMQPKAIAHVENVTRDLNTKCAQLEAALRQMGGLVPPPPHLQIRVAGAYYPNFIEHGEALLDNLETALASSGKSFRSFEKVLDFGCGCSRVLRALHYRASPAQKLFGADIDAEAIEWCRANYAKVAEFSVNQPDPPLPSAEDTFDLVFSVSIFTHLPEDMQFTWFKELRRVTKPGGFLLITTCSETYFQKLPLAVRQSALAKGFYYGHAGDTEGLPGFYQTAYHSPGYIRSRWSEYFDILDVRERAVDNHQDITVCRKR